MGRPEADILGGGGGGADAPPRKRWGLGEGGVPPRRTPRPNPRGCLKAFLDFKFLEPKIAIVFSHNGSIWHQINECGDKHNGT